VGIGLTAVATGPDNIVGERRRRGPGLPFALSGRHLGEAFSKVAHAPFVTSQFAALLSVHNLVARYFCPLEREGLPPGSLSGTTAAPGRRSPRSS
jgi:hypothetical protein